MRAGRQAGENPYRATLTLETTVYTDTGNQYYEYYEYYGCDYVLCIIVYITLILDTTVYTDTGINQYYQSLLIIFLIL